MFIYVECKSLPCPPKHLIKINVNFMTKKEMSKKIEAVALLFNIKTDSFGEMESGELDNIWRVITALASEMGYQVNTYQGTLIKIKK